MNKFKIDKEKFKTFIMCSTIFLVVLSIIALISGSIMKIFGFQYKSIGNIVLFFIIATIMSFPLNLIAGAFPKAFLKLGKINRQTAFIIYLILDTIATSFGLLVVDYYMPTVSATNISIIIISLLFAFMGKDDFNNVD